MKAATYIKQAALADDPRWRALADGLAAGGVELYPVSTREDIRPATDLLLSVGGDGTFLSASIQRSGAAILGIRVAVDGQSLPVFWADGLLVATSSGSTAYSLSVGGPICSPEAPVLVIAPIAPHNLNVRPLVVPESAHIDISVVSRDSSVRVSLDNRTALAPPTVRLSVHVAQFSLKRIRLPESGFVKALTSKLFWGEDIRSGME